MFVGACLMRRCRCSQIVAFPSTNLDEVAATAGLTKGAIYSEFCKRGRALLRDDERSGPDQDRGHPGRARRGSARCAKYPRHFSTSGDF